jgi:hypothetical protein
MAVLAAIRDFDADLKSGGKGRLVDCIAFQFWRNGIGVRCGRECRGDVLMCYIRFLRVQCRCGFAPPCENAKWNDVCNAKISEEHNDEDGAWDHFI